MTHSPSRSWLRFAPFVLLGGLGFCAVAMQVDPGGDLPQWPAGPGLTVDEGFNVEEGVRLAEAAKAWFAGEITWREVFGRRAQLGLNAPFGYHLADHPPAARYWFGLWHELGSAVLEPDDAEPRVVVAYARLGSAAAFGLLILLVGIVCTRWYGLLAGLVSAVSLILMPRLFGHAHLASLETLMNLTYTAAVLGVASWWKSAPEKTPHSPPRLSHAAFAGVLLGLALLTKIQGVLIGPPAIIWALWHWRGKAILPLAVWGGAAFAVFFIGWPWLWFDPLDHTLQYFRSSTDRATLYVWYLGDRFADSEAPWHYPFLMFLITVPAGLLFWGVWGFAGWNADQKPLSADGRLQLILAALVFPLILFALPGVAVYDGVRLFLVSYPLWAIAAGRGAALMAAWLQHRAGKKTGLAALGTILALQGIGLWVTSPLYLNYYNLLVGGLTGADTLGFETNYWGDSLTREFWNEVAEMVPPGSTVHVTPVLHPLQLAFMQNQLPQLKRQQIQLAPCVPEQMHEVTYLARFHRKADLAPRIEESLEGIEPRREITRQGVPLGTFYVLRR